MKKRHARRERHGYFIVLGIILIGSPGAAQIVENPEAAESPPVPSEFSIGIGVGIPYGGALGLNVDLVPILPDRLEGLGRYMSLGAGLGLHPDYFLDHSLGMMLHPMGKRGLIQPHLSFQYGLVDIIYHEFGHEDIRGISAGAGARLRIHEKFSIDADLDYILYAFDLDIEDLTSRSVFSLGARWHP